MPDTELLQIRKRVKNEWPTASVVEKLKVEAGWSPIPITQYILKIHGRCNLACDYCYMYEMADQSWSEKPVRMSKAIFSRVVKSMSDHVKEHGLRDIDVVLHGGEPLLVGEEFLVWALELIRNDPVLKTIHVGIVVQTNGLRLSSSILELFLHRNVFVSVSLDGGKAEHDRHRKFRNGNGSFDRIAESLKLFQADRYKPLFLGLLCTIDIQNDPLSTYAGLLEFDPPAVNFLLPHGNWDVRPPGFSQSASTSYADWLIPIFDEWFYSTENKTGVRLFENILSLLVGGSSNTETVGLSPAALVVIETDGSIEQVDNLKSAYEGASNMDLTLNSNSLNEVLYHPSIVARQLGEYGLSDECRNCTIKNVCGGGMYAHRYSSENGFLNRSVFCDDLYKLITHIGAAVRSELQNAELKC